MCKCFNKCMLIGVNVVFLILGLALTGLGIWVIVSKDSMFKFLDILTKDVNVDKQTMKNYESTTSTLMAAAYVAVAFGGFSVIVGFCGFCGAIKENSCLLITYAVSVSIIVVAEIAGGIAAAVFKNQISDQLRPKLIAVERDHFLPWNMTIGNDKDSDAIISTYVNYIQVLLECCGVSGPTDITNNDTLWYKSNPTYNGLKQVVPLTCCPMKSEKGKLLSNSDWSNAGNYLKDPNCPNTGAGNFMVGCYEKINNELNNYAWPVIIVCILVGLFEIFCIVMAACIVHKIRKQDSMHV